MGETKQCPTCEADLEPATQWTNAARISPAPKRRMKMNVSHASSKNRKYTKIIKDKPTEMDFPVYIVESSSCQSGRVKVFVPDVGYQFVQRCTLIAPKTTQRRLLERLLHYENYYSSG